MSKSKDRPLLEAILTNIEVAVDAATSNEAVASIPVIGTAFKLCKGIDDIRSRAFAAKLERFIATPDLATPAARVAILAKVQTSPDEARKVGETLFLVLDRFIDLDKPEILAKVFIAFIDNQVSAEDLQRLAQAIDQAFCGDLHSLLQADEHAINGGSLAATNLPWMRTLIPSGLTINNAGGVGVVKTKNEFTYLGQLLWKAWRHELREP
jgi:hypothetical protein